VQIPKKGYLDRIPLGKTFVNTLKQILDNFRVLLYCIQVGKERLSTNKGEEKGFVLTP